MNQIIRELSNEMKHRLKDQRDWVANHYDSIDLYVTVEGKLNLISLILNTNWIKKNEIYKLQCLGVTLGDALVQDLNFRWIEIEDDYGVDPAIQLEYTSFILFPLTMISKRIEKNERVDILDLFNKLKIKALELKNVVDKK